MKSFVIVDDTNEFPIQNLPYGVFRKKTNPQGPSRIAVAIGDFVLDLQSVAEAGLLNIDAVNTTKCFHETSLNSFMALGLSVWKEVRHNLQTLLSDQEGALRDNPGLRETALIPMSEVVMQLPAQIGDYTDFFCSKDHAANCGVIFGRGDNPLLDNWKTLPVAYHGRSSSIVVSDTPVTRPRGQVRPGEAPATLEPSQRCDFELEMGFFVGVGNELGTPIDINNARDHIFGMVLLNDWSARDVQKYEYVPLGPFGAKNWATSISPWVVTLDALDPFLVPAAPQDLAPVPHYLTHPAPTAFNINLQVSILPEASSNDPSIVTKSNLRNLYWTAEQMLSHHTITGCNMRPGDLFASGTISGAEEESRGCMLELSWGGTKGIPLENEEGAERKFLQDGDTVTLSGYAQGDGFRIGFGPCRGKLNASG